MSSKTPKADYLISSDVEKKIMEACVSQGLHHLAMAQSTENGLTSKEKLEYKHNTLLASSLLCYTNEIDLLKDWEAIDWSLATHAPDLIAYSGNKDAIRLAPIEWGKLKTAQINLKVHDHAWEYENPRASTNEYFWIVQKMLVDPMGPFGAFSLNDRIGDIGFKNHEVFWDTVLATNKVSPHTPVTSSRFPEMGEMALLDAVLLCNRSYVCEKMLPLFHPSSPQATKTLTALLLSNEIKGSQADDVIEKCLNAPVDLSTPLPFPLDRFVSCVSNPPSWGNTASSCESVDEEEFEGPQGFPLGLTVLSSRLSGTTNDSPSWSKLVETCHNYIANLPNEQQKDLFSLWAQQLDFSVLRSDAMSEFHSLLKTTSPEVQGIVVGQAFKNCFSAKMWGRETISDKLAPALRVAEILSPVLLPLDDFKGFLYRLQTDIEKSPKDLPRLFETVVRLKDHIVNDRFAEMIDYLDASPEKALLGLKILEADLVASRSRPSQSFKKM